MARKYKINTYVGTIGGALDGAKADIESPQPEKPGCECSEDNADADDWDTPIDALEEAENEGVEFPGMY